MNVKELKEILNQYPDDYFVALDCREGFAMGVNNISSWGDCVFISRKYEGFGDASTYVAKDTKNLRPYIISEKEYKEKC